MPLIMNNLGFMHNYQSGSGIPPDFPTALTSSVTMWFDGTNYRSGSNIWVDRLSSTALDVSGVTYSGSAFHFTQDASSYVSPVAGFTPRSASRGTLVVTYRSSNTSSGSEDVSYNTNTLKGNMVHFGKGESNIALSRVSNTIVAPGAGELKYTAKGRWSGKITTSSYARQNLGDQMPLSIYWPNTSYLTPINGQMAALTFSGSEQRSYWSHQGSGTNPQYDEAGEGQTNNTFIGVPSGSFLYLGGAVRQTDGVVDISNSSITGQFTGSIDNVLYFDRFMEESELNTLRDYLY